MIRILCLLVFISVITIFSAYAAPSDVIRAKRALIEMKGAERLLNKSAKGLTRKERALIKSSYRGSDSDGDRLPDALEGPFGANSCDADSDDDGLDDYADSDEDNSDSDGDGVSDGDEVEVKGRIKSFNDPILVIGTTTLRITAATVLLRGLTKANLTANICVQVEGHRASTEIVVDKIKREDCESDDD